MFQFKTTYKQLLADTVTPVHIYLKLRDKYPNTIMLESSDYHGNDNSLSFICFDPIASFVVKNGEAVSAYPNGEIKTQTITKENNLKNILSNFSSQFKIDQTKFPFPNNGLFGYIGYDSIQYFEDIKVDKKNDLEIPEVMYHVYRNVIAINHFKEELFIFDHTVDANQKSNLDEIESLIYNRNLPAYEFFPHNDEKSNFTDTEFLSVIDQGKKHCMRGDVFQLVLSRRFMQTFHGDEFNVYRALRSINPSPYLFFFDYGNFKVFGSSPETQIMIKNNKASIFPIAGTFRRTGDDEADAKLAEKLEKDPKETAEHVMLVDLARNDLSRDAENVLVETFKEIQYYSHVIHLVSKVSGTLKDKGATLKVVADTFPAGTLSGAPKFKAMQLINEYEKSNRSLYGGCIGFLGFNGDFNHAIMIRSFVSKNNTLYYQAGAGVVAASDSQSELNEVNNKLMALRTAVELAASPKPSPKERA